MLGDLDIELLIDNWNVTKTVGLNKMHEWQGRSWRLYFVLYDTFDFNCNTV